VDNVIFGGGWGILSLSGAGIVLANNVFGVMDHDTIHGIQYLSTFNTYTCNDKHGCGGVLANVNHSAWQGVGQYGDNSFAQPDTLGSSQSLFVENNLTDNGSGVIDTDASVGGTQNIGGGSYVCRYNNITGAGVGGGCSNHGTETTGRPRGARQGESYGNTFTCNETTGTTGCGTGS
jgi:hypothetical protein